MKQNFTTAAKQNLRQEMRRRRAALSPAEKQRAALQIAARLRALPSIQNAGAVCAIYLATPEEANLDEFIGWLLQKQLPVYAPQGKNFARLQSLEAVNMGNFGVREPRSEPQNAFANSFVPLPGDTLFFVPGLAFDARGGRLGFGGGWYDRALARFPQALKIGIAFDCQIVSEVPCDAHDVKMNFVITPSQTMKCPLE